MGASFEYTTSQGSHALLAAARTGGYACVHLLLEHGAHVMVNVLYGGYVSPLCTTIANRSSRTETECMQIVQALINAGANINHRGLYDKTPLLLALERDMLLVTKALLAAGASYEYLHSQYDETLSDLGYKKNNDFTLNE